MSPKSSETNPILHRKSRLFLLPFLAALSLVLASCGADDDSDPNSVASTPLAVANAWVKATDTEMTGTFADITNNSDETITIVSATNSLSDKTELHETIMVDGQPSMAAKEGGLEVAAGETLTLEPGGSHVMIMMLQKPVQAGDQIKVDLMLNSGETVTFDALAKEASAGDEPYHETDGTPGSSSSPNPSMSMG